VRHLARERIEDVRGWFTPERPGPVILPHIRNSGIGSCLVDRWPQARVVIAETAGNYAIRGDPAVLDESALDDVSGFVQAVPAWEPLLRRVDPGLAVWNRVTAVLPAHAPVVTPAPGPLVRRITESEAAAVEQ
jgi:hypothetical protein